MLSESELTKLAGVKKRVLLFTPLFVYYSEVRQSLSNAQSQFSQWSMLLDSEVDIDKIQGVGTELKNCIKSIEWDLEDLDQTISELISDFRSRNISCLSSLWCVCLEIAEGNPNKFRLDYGELESRKQFIRDTRAVIKVSWDGTEMGTRPA